MIALGSKVRDTVTGLTGIVVSRTEWLNGCARLGVQPQELKDGKPVDMTVVDEPQLEVVDAEHPATKDRQTTTGGPKDDVSATTRH